MDERRVLEELTELKKDYPEIAWNRVKGEVVIRNIKFPEGWTPNPTSLKFRLPHNYPLQYPEVWFPDGMLFHNKGTHLHLGIIDGNWHKMCVRKFPTWNPHKNSMTTMMRMVYQALKYPNNSDPWDK